MAPHERPATPTGRHPRRRAGRGRDRQPLARPLWIGRGVAAGRRHRCWCVYPLLSDDIYYQNMIILSLVFAVGASGLNIISGFAGYVSLGQGAFIGLGGYTIGVLAARTRTSACWLWFRRSPAWWPRLVALVLGLVSLRSSGPAFVIITVAFLFLVQVIAVNWVLAHQRHRGPDAAAARRGTATSSTGRSTTRWSSILGAAAADDLVDPAHQARHGPDRDPRGRDQGRHDRHQPAGREDHRLHGERLLRRHGRRGLRLLPDLHRPARHVQHPAQRAARALAADRRQGHPVGSGARRVPDRAAQRVSPTTASGGGNTRLFLFGGLLVAGRDLPAQGHPAGDRVAAARGGVRRGKAGLVGARIGTGGSLASLTDRVQLVDRAEIPDRPLLEVKGLRKSFGGRQGRRRRVVRRAGGVDHRPDRAQRLGQDHPLQPDRRHHPRRLRRDLARRAADRRPALVEARPPRAGPHLPDHPALPRDDGPGERRGRPARPSRWASSAGSRSAAAEAQRGRGAAGVRRDAGVPRPEGAARCPTASRSWSSWPRS